MILLVKACAGETELRESSRNYLIKRDATPGFRARVPPFYHINFHAYHILHEPRFFFMNDTYFINNCLDTSLVLYYNQKQSNKSSGQGAIPYRW